MPITIPRGGTFKYVVNVTNTGIQHDVNVGVTLYNPIAGYVDLPWIKLVNLPSGQGYKIEVDLGLIPPYLWVMPDLLPGTYDATCKAWETSTGGKKLGDINSIGALYANGTLSGELDVLRKPNELIVTEVAEVAADIAEFYLAV